MKPICGIKTIKGAIGLVSFIGAASVIIQLFSKIKTFQDNCTEGESECTKRFWMIGGIGIAAALFLCIAIAAIRLGLVGTQLSIHIV